MSSTALVATIVAMFLAFGAALSMARAAAYTSGWVRRAFRVSSVLGFAYGCAYLWLLHNPDSSEAWSETLRPIGVAAWAIVWLWLPWLLTNDVRRRARMLDREADRISPRG